MDGPRIGMAALSKYRSFCLFAFNVSFQNEIPANFFWHHDLSLFVLTEYYDFAPLIIKDMASTGQSQKATGDHDQVACFGVNAYEAFLKGQGI